MNIFKRPNTRYGATPEPETPYQRAAQVWDDRIGSARVQARNWRTMAFGCLFLLGGAGSALVWQSAQGTVVPWVVEVDRLGDVRTVGPAVANYEPSDAQIERQLEDFIKWVRSLPIDPVVVKDNWLRAYDFTTDRGAAALNDYARTNDPFTRVGRQQVTVQISSSIRASPNSFRVAWTEEHFENSQRVRTERWTAILTIVIRPSRSADLLKKNPLGVYIHAISWSREVGQ